MSGNALIARLADRQREIAVAVTSGAHQARYSVAGLSPECRRLMDVMIGALQRMNAGRVTIHAARTGDDFGGFRKKRPMRPEPRGVQHLNAVQRIQPVTNQSEQMRQILRRIGLDFQLELIRNAATIIVQPPKPVE